SGRHSRPALGVFGANPRRSARVYRGPVAGVGDLPRVGAPRPGRAVAPPLAHRDCRRPHQLPAQVPPDPLSLAFLSAALARADDVAGAGRAVAVVGRALRVPRDQHSRTRGDRSRTGRLRGPYPPGVALGTSPGPVGSTVSVPGSSGRQTSRPIVFVN